MTLRTGDRVHQATYGLGGIVKMNRQHVTIAFDDGITRKFVTSMVLLQPSDTPPPPKRQATPRAKGMLRAAAKRAAHAKGAS
ncbi:MAG TPA: hypothetical protein PLH72_12425 [Vicinamibacterales bacterium]|nr:hypothetical protein [Vicinamibacterales bacterium]